MDKFSKIQKITTLQRQIEVLSNQERLGPEFSKWKRDVEVALEKIFGKNTRHIPDFRRISYSLMVFTTSTPDYEFEQAYQSGLKLAHNILQSFIDEINEYEEIHLEKTIKNSQPATDVLFLLSKFHKIQKQLQNRYSNRPTIEIKDEYDVQYLLHALLMLYFDDVRPEEYTPSYAGSASRIDFLLKNEKIVVEVKKTRSSLKDKELGEQLLVDIQKYQAHPDCNHLICFVYDPEGFIQNPYGLQKDLSKNHGSLPVSVIITPQN